MPLAASVFTVISAERERAQTVVTDGRPAQPTLAARRAARFLSLEPPQGRGPRDNEEAVPPRPRPKPRLRRPRGWKSCSLAGGGGRFGPRPQGEPGAGAGGAGTAREARRGTVICLSGLPGWREGNRRRRGWGEGESGVIFHLSHLFRPARKSESRHWGAFRPVLGRPVALCPLWFVRLCLPIPSRSRSRASPLTPPAASSAPTGRPRTTSPRCLPGEGGPARPHPRGHRGPGTPGGSPAPTSFSPSLSPFTLRTRTHPRCLSPEPSD